MDPWIPNFIEILIIEPGWKLENPKMAFEFGIELEIPIHFSTHYFQVT